MLQQLETADAVRRAVSPRITQKHKAAFGQFLTPSSVARFMASLFPSSPVRACRLLDAGAGVGALSCAFLDRWATGEFGFDSVKVTAYEIDGDLCGHLARHLAGYMGITSQIITGDYIELATAGGLFATKQPSSYTHAILNPPYKKIGSNSAYRLALRRIGIETVNLYSAFVALALTQAAPGGQIVAIIPRSFCNGPYYRPFRDFMLKHAAIRHIHLFESRNTAFKDDAVLQENVIIRLERDGKQGAVRVSTSTDDTFMDLVAHKYPFECIVLPDDPERFIRVPSSPKMEAETVESSPAIRHTLADLGITVSTGPVVDFRLKKHLRSMPDEKSVPLLYPSHFSGTGTTWPIRDMKKPNAIERSADTEKWLYPSGFYCVVRRLSSKEEKRRIVASVVEPSVFGNVSVLGFENHLNLFHENKRGLPEMLARGLAVFLNTTAVDKSFRCFNGHTQVNATDLKLIKYPNRETLIEFGQWAMQQGTLTQDQIDAKLKALTK